MSLTHNYKKIENRFFDRMAASFSRGTKKFRTRKMKFLRLLGRRYTVMIIPHTEKKAVNFKISFATIFTLCAFVVVLSAVTVVLGILFASGGQTISSAESRMTAAEAENEEMKDSVAQLRHTARNFETVLSETLDSFGLSSQLNRTTQTAGDYASFVNVEAHDGQTVRELQDVKNISRFLELSMGELSRISGLLSSKGNLLEEIPTGWPVERGRGYISAPFGPAQHPIRGYWYLHNALDIAYTRGTGVVATANGKVVEVTWHEDYGNYLTIQHKYGFYTRYAHCDAIYVSEGDTVAQGQRIAALGNTGLTTGPHVHYEIRIGSQNIDPIRFLSME